MASPAGSEPYRRTLMAWTALFKTELLTPTTFATGACVVGLAVLLLLSLGIMFSVLFNNTVMAVTSLMLVWYVASSIFGFLGAEYLSPFALSRNLPRMLKDPNAPQLADGKATRTGISLTFSKPLDSISAEQPANYAIASPDGASYTPQTAVYDRPANTVVLAGLALPAGAKLNVSVRNLTDEGGAVVSPVADSVQVDVPVDTASEQKVGGSGNSSLPQRPGSVANAANRTVDAGSKLDANSSATASDPGFTGDRNQTRVLRCTATPGSVKILFSAPLNVKDAEAVENYTVECPQGKTRPARTTTYSATTHTVLLSGFSFSLDDPVKVTVKHVRSPAGVQISLGNNTTTYAALTTWKYVLGLGAPSLIAFIVSVFWFARRDL